MYLCTHVLMHTCTHILTLTHMHSGYVHPPGGHPSSSCFSQEAAPLTRHYPVYDDSQFIRGYHHLPPPLGGHHEATPQSTRQLAIPHSYQSGFEAQAQPSASISSLHQGGELFSTVSVLWMSLSVSWDNRKGLGHG